MNIKEIINKNWLKIIYEIDNEIIEETEKKYNELSDNKIIYPKYKKIFNFSNYSILDDVKVIIIGQDSYHGTFYNKRGIKKPQANGLSFSVPKGCKVPPSLNNIYENLKKYNHIIDKPDHGDLKYWSYQGVLLLNCSLSVEESKPNSHKDVWKDFTDKLVEIISKKYKNLIFLLWGKEAYSKLENNIIFNNDHHFVISSHPSSFSAYNNFRNYKSFMETDHFGTVNMLLKKNYKKEIDLQII